MKCFECKTPMEYTKGSHETGWGDVTLVVESEYWECPVCYNRTFEPDEVRRLQDIGQQAAGLATD
jgi:hypothetical protein